MPTHQEQNAAVRDQFGKQAPSYARLTGEGGRNIMLEALIDAVKPTTTDRALDVGCGPGRLSLQLAKLVADVTGIDLTPEMLAQAKALQAEHQVKNVSWYLGDSTAMPFDNDAFSLVVTSATFHHFADPAAVLTEMMRVCAPGGRIVVNDLTPDPEKGVAFDHMEKLRDPSHVHALQQADLRTLGHTAGLAELTCVGYEISLPFEAILATSFPAPGNLERARALMRDDAVSGANRCGYRARMEGGQVMVSYSMTMMAWSCP